MILKINYFIGLILLITQLLVGASDQRLNEKIIYNELDIEYNYDPYIEVGLWEGKYKRLYSLIHDTVYENDNTSTISLYPNFIYNIDNIVVELDNEDKNNDGIRSQMIITMPTNTEASFYFSDNSIITAEDVKSSIQYAICTGVIKESLIPYKNIKIIGTSVHIASPFYLTRDIYISYLKNVYVLPSNCFADYIDQGCNVIKDPGDDSYWDNSCIEEWNDIINFVGSGPFYISDYIEEKELILDRNPHYYYEHLDYDGYIIKINSLRNNHANDLKQDTNLAIDIPLSTISNQNDPELSKNKLETYTANLLWINYTNKNMLDPNFRKALYYAIDKETIVNETFSFNAKLLTGPISEIATFYDHFLPDHSIGTHENDIIEAKKLLTGSGYRIKSAPSNDPDNFDVILYDSSDKPVEIKLMYNDAISQFESDALKSIGDNLKDIGIRLTYLSIKGKLKFETMKTNSLQKWDLCYDRLLIRDPLHLENYYSNEGIYNYGRYSNSDVDNLFYNLQNENNPQNKTTISKHIHQTLLGDVGSIYLWRLYTHYVFYNRQINPMNKNMVDSEHFFVTPHKWKMVK